MALSNLVGWEKANVSSACGASDKPVDQPAGCGAADKPADQPAGCGAADKPAEKPAACGSACGAGDNK